MSRNLPARPNLEHLKHQARDLLADLKRDAPGAQLADALHEIAREYGFPSWPKLKTHVEALAASASPLAGAWIADLVRSTRHPLHQFRSARMHFAVSGDRVTVKDIVVDADGKMLESTHSILADGAPHVTPNGYVLTATWRDARVLETEATKDGAIVGRGRYELSDDGSTLTVTADDMTVVCVRGGR